jgi:hypothetical protein
MIEAPGVGAGLALRVRNSQFFRGVTPGLYLFVGQATPGIPTKKNPNDPGMCGIISGAVSSLVRYHLWCGISGAVSMVRYPWCGIHGAVSMVLGKYL